MPNKNIHTVLGDIIGCSSYDPCPLCYGCRNFDPSRVKCQNYCEYKNPKYNICDRYKHNDAALSMMIRRSVIKVEQKQD